MTDTSKNDNKEQNDNKKRKIDQIREDYKDAFKYMDDDDVYWRRTCNECMMHVENKVIQINNEKKKVKIRSEAIELNYKMEFLRNFLEKLAKDDDFFETIHDIYYDGVTPNVVVVGP